MLRREKKNCRGCDQYFPLRTQQKRLENNPVSVATNCIVESAVILLHCTVTNSATLD
jgi:hypothetical protein